MSHVNPVNAPVEPSSFRDRFNRPRHVYSLSHMRSQWFAAVVSRGEKGEKGGSLNLANCF